MDIYRLKIGVRTLHWNSQEFLINGKPIYFRGFGRHEDSDVNIISENRFPNILISFILEYYLSCVDSWQRLRFSFVDQGFQFDQMDWCKRISHITLSIFRRIHAIC